jgi:hypothetical protein
MLATITLAITFTGFQAVEYNVSSFTISDGIFGSCFYFSTGFHGYVRPLVISFPKPKGVGFYLKKNIATLPLKQNTLTSRSDDKEPFNLDINFLEWLAGFTDAEGNFSITLRNKQEITPPIHGFQPSGEDHSFTYSSVTLTFQLGLHIDDLKVLELIKQKLQCGKISISEANNRCNFFVNDSFSLIHVIVPIFKHVQLNSSKYVQFKVFEEAVNLLVDKAHLLPEGKIKMIDCKNRLNKDYKLPDSINISYA